MEYLDNISLQATPELDSHLIRKVDIANKLDKTGDAKDNTVTFTDYTGTSVITTGDTLSVVAGKTKKQLDEIKSLTGLGGILESGNNANGSYLKYADGTQMCLGSINNGVSYNTGWYDLTFPSVFINNIISVGITPSHTNNIQLYGKRTVVSNYVGLTVKNADNSTVVVGTSLVFDFIAIGRWKA